MTPAFWIEANQHYMSAALDLVRSALERRAGDTSDERERAARQALTEARAAMPAPPALEMLCAVFRLSPFERDLLVLCAGPELDSSFTPLCAAAQGDPALAFPNFSLALATLPDAHWSAIAPAGPLRYWRLLEIAEGRTLTQSPLRLDEWLLHHLTDTGSLDGRLEGLLEPLRAERPLPPSQSALAERLAEVLEARGSAAAAVQLCGPHAGPKRAVAATACAARGLPLYALPADLLPAAPAEQDLLCRLWDREAAVTGSVLLVDCQALEGVDALRLAGVTRFLERLAGPLLVAAREPLPGLDREALRLDVRKPTRTEQHALWRDAVGPAAAALDGQLSDLVAQFDLDAPAIEGVGRAVARGQMDVAALGRQLWDACRTRSRTRLEDLAQRIEPAATWEDLVLPDLQLDLLQELVAHVRRRARVYDAWGFAAKSARGLGISALFAGPSGTGKTLAAEVLANELRLDLHRIDLSAVVSKYIGETEKNLRRVFDAAEEGGSLLLFDEADALFGKRSEIKDSHDRYANIEVSYLLQRMETHRGLAVLTTNLKGALDHAFLRRIRFVVQFPFPDPGQRAQIWRRIFPAATPTQGVDTAKLARLNVTGGSIRNIAVSAAFLAADEGGCVRMRHLLRATRGEYAKLERPLTQEEVGGWT